MIGNSEWSVFGILRTMSVCGDGKTLDDEECDDANQIDGDGCSRYCWIEKGYQCDTPTSFTVRGEISVTAKQSRKTFLQIFGRF